MVKNGNLKVDPLRKDVGNKSIGGFTQSKRDGNHVPGMDTNDLLKENKNHNEPNDGKDGGVPGDARELLRLAHQLHTERKKHSD